MSPRQPRYEALSRHDDRQEGDDDVAGEFGYRSRGDGTTGSPSRRDETQLESPMFTSPPDHNAITKWRFTVTVVNSAAPSLPGPFKGQLYRAEGAKGRVARARDSRTATVATGRDSPPDDSSPRIPGTLRRIDSRVACASQARDVR